MVGAEATPDGGADAGDSGCAAVGDAGGGDAGEGGLPCMALQPGLHTLGLGDNPTNTVTLSIGNWTASWSAATSGTAVDITGTLTWMPNSANTRLPNDPAQTLGGVNALALSDDAHGPAGEVPVGVTVAPRPERIVEP